MDGKVNITEDYKQDFEKVYEELKKTQEKIIKIKTEYKEIEEKIQRTDFEISKLNSCEFDVDI